MFEQLHLFEITSELASENINAYISPVPIHEYIQNKFLTCTREVGDPILSQNIDLSSTGNVWDGVSKTLLNARYELVSVA